MEKINESLEIKSEITNEYKEILNTALDGINGWDFNPIAVVTNDSEEYYFICKVKTIIENLQMKLAKVSIKILNTKPRLLSIEEIA